MDGQGKTCRKGSPLMQRIVLIILLVIALYLLVQSSVSLWYVEKVAAPAGSNEAAVRQSAIVFNIIGIVVAVMLAVFAIYNLAFPDGTLKNYLAPYVNQRPVADVSVNRGSM